MSDLKNLLESIKNELTQKEKVAEDAHEAMRKITSSSKQAILLSHQGKREEAKKKLDTAKDQIRRVRGLAKEYPAITFWGMFSAALQEYSEANIFLKLIEEGRFVLPSEIDVPAVDYVLGLADVVGEFRRFALDALRKGDVSQGEKCLLIMDEIYVELEALDEAYMLVPGLRRKNDLARRVIESTRGDITQEVSRKALEEHLNRFEKNLRARAKPLRKG